MSEEMGKGSVMNERVESGKRKASMPRPGVWSVVGLTLALGIPVAGQSPFQQFPSANSGQYGQHNPDVDSPFGKDPNSPEQKRIRALNAERQKALVSDAEKLLKLAKELNDELAQSTSGPMNAAQLHKVEEIGKLAKSVKEKMSFTAGGFPSLTIQPPIQ